ncbi:MAG: hypothetical protein RL213_133 [Bacteroidota bacterium]
MSFFIAQIQLERKCSILFQIEKTHVLTNTLNKPNLGVHSFLLPYENTPKRHKKLKFPINHATGSGFEPPSGGRKGLGLDFYLINERMSISGITKESVINGLEELAKGEISEEIFTKANDYKNDFLRISENARQEQLHAFVEGGGAPEEFEAPKDPLDQRFNELLIILHDRQQKFKKLRAEEVRSNLLAKKALVEELEKLVNEETNIGKAFQSFRDIQNKWKDIGNVPDKEYKDLQSAYHRHVHNFYYNMKLSKDLRDLDFKRNLELREQLLSKIESLLPMESIRGVERMLTLYRMEWSECGPTSQDTIEPLKTRYRELIGQVLQRIRDYYQSRREEETKNLEAKKVLLERAKGIAAEDFDTPKQWQTMTDTLNKILDDWKKVGYGPKEENDRIWDEFRRQLNEFYRKKKAFFGELKKTNKVARDRKSELITKAAGIAATSPENWEDATRQVIELQKEWKTAGSVESWEENKLWKKFREACDKFFEAKRGFYNERDSDQLENLKKKEELIARLEAFTPGGNSQQDLQTLRDFSNEWKTIEHVPFKEKQRIWEKFKKTMDAKYDSMKLEASEMHLAKFRSNVELLSQSGDSGKLMSREKNFIKDKISKLQQTILQYENNLGFFRSSKNMEGLLKEVESNLQRAKDEMDLLKKKLKMFDAPQQQPPAKGDA